MFIYEKNGAICVTFKDNKPVAAPEYVIAIDAAGEQIYINGKVYVDPKDPIDTPVEEKPVTKRATRPTKVTDPVKETPVETVEETVTEAAE